MASSKRTKGKGKSKGKGKVLASKAAQNPAERAVAPRNKPVYAQAILEQEQSFEQMKIMTIAVISRITIARDLFPNLSRKYRLRTYDPANPDPSYEAFVEGKGSSGESFKPTDNIAVWKLIPPGVDKAADKVLAWVEEGISAAIERGYLEKFELTIHSVDDGPIRYGNLLESYTMSFTYGANPQMQISGHSGHNKYPEPELLFSAKDKLYNLVQAIGDKFRIEGAEFPQLPGQCRLGMALLFNDNCPRGYQPPLFRAGDTETLKILRAASTDNKLSMDTRFHSVSVGWSLATLPPNNAAEFSQTPAHQIEIRPKSHQTSSCNEGDTQEAHMAILRQVKFSRSYSDSSHDTRRLRSSSILTPPPVRTRTSKVEQADGLPLPYTQEINLLIRKIRGNAKSQHIQGLACECDSLDADGELIKCEICAKQQHYECYGYIDSRPCTHVCYRCLSQHSPGQLDWSQFHNLCVTRRALYYVHTHGPVISNSGLGMYLGCDKSNTDQVLAELGQRNLVKISASHQKKKNSKGETHCFLDGVDLASIFDPAKDIQHLLTFSNDSMPESLLRGFSLHDPPRGYSLSPSLGRGNCLAGPGSDSSSTVDDEIDINGGVADPETPLSRPLRYERARTPWQPNSQDNKRKADTMTEKTNNGKKLKTYHMGAPTSPATLDRG